MKSLGAALAINFLLILAFVVFWFLALIDVVSSKFEQNNKIIWILLLVFLAPIGTILYFTIGKKQKIVTAGKRLTLEGRDKIYDKVVASGSSWSSADIESESRTVDTSLAGTQGTVRKSGPPFKTKEEYEEWKAERMKQNEDKA
jgi:ABC-type transport system involved in cytochrome bd biosynthesis fused ATPase/permease subunit